MSPAWKQLRLPFPSPKETQTERCRRVLSGVPAGKVWTATKVFDYAQASATAKAAQTGRAATPLDK